MATFYVVWDVTTGDLVSRCESEEAARAVLRERLRAHGPTSIMALSLTRVNPDGSLFPMAEASALVEYAQCS